METISETRNHIIREIIEFYKIQPGVPLEKLEKLEEYLVLMNSFLVEALNDLNEIEISNIADNVEDIIDALNTYINSISEESRKIFPNNFFDLSPLIFTSGVKLNEIQIVEYLKNLEKKINYFNESDEQLIRLEKGLYSIEFTELLHQVVFNLILAIHSDIIVRVEDLI